MAQDTPTTAQTIPIPTTEPELPLIPLDESALNPEYDPAKDQRAPFLKTPINPTGPTISPAPTRSVGQVIKEAATENIPQFSSRTVSNPNYGKQSFLPDSEIMTQQQRREAPALAGALDVASELASPATIGTVAATAGVGEAGVIPKVLSGLFAGQIATSVYDQYPALKDAVNRAQTAKTKEAHDDAFADAQRLLTHMGADTVMGLLAAKHGAEGAKEILDTTAGSGVPDQASTFKNPGVEPAAEPEETHPEMNRDTVKQLQKLGYSNQHITNFNIGEIRDILKNQTPAAEHPVSKAAPAPAVTAPEPDKFAESGGKLVGSVPKTETAVEVASSTEPLSAEKSQTRVSEIRAGDARSKNQGIASYERPTGQLVQTQLPISSFSPEHIDFLRESTDPERVANYAQQQINTPIYATPGKRGPNAGKYVISDGGHRLLAAIDRGDTTIPALIPAAVEKPVTPVETTPETADPVEDLIMSDKIGGKKVKGATPTLPTGHSIVHEDALPGSIAENTASTKLQDKTGKERGHVWTDYAPKAKDIAGTNTAEITHSILDEDLQNQGIGKELYRTAIEKAREKGFSRIVSDTDKSRAAVRVWSALAREYPVTNIEAPGQNLRYVIDLTQPNQPQPEAFAEHGGKFVGKSPALPAVEYHPDLQKLSEQNGGVTSTPQEYGASFITPDGKFIHLASGDHNIAIARAKGESQHPSTDNRTEFLQNTGAVRVRISDDTAGKTMHVSVPEQGATPEQVDAIKANFRTSIGNRGNLVMENSSGKKYTEGDNPGFTTANDIEPMLREIGAHPDQQDLISKSKIEEGPHKSSYAVEVTENDGTQRIEKIDAHTNNEAMKLARKKFPEAGILRRPEMDETHAPSNKYEVPTGKRIKMPPSYNRPEEDTERHEVAHALVALKGGLQTGGVLSSHHPIVPSDARAVHLLKGVGLRDPATGRIREDKRTAVLASGMAGIASDEIQGVPRAANPNFFINEPGDGGSAYSILKAAGFSHEDALTEMHRLIDENIEYLKHPAYASVVNENVGAREKGLSRQFHYSPERLQNMHAEIERRKANGEPTATDNRTSDEATAAGRSSNVPGGEGEVSAADKGLTPEGEEGIVSEEKIQPKNQEWVDSAKWEENPNTGYRRLVLRDDSGKQAGRIAHDNYRIRLSELDDKYVNQGIGKALYERAFADAKQNGVKELMSDTSLSPDAARVWDSLAKSGKYNITAEPSKEVNRGKVGNAYDNLHTQYTVHFDQPKDIVSEEKINKTPKEMTPELAQQIVDAHKSAGGSTFSLTHGNLAGTENYSVSTNPERGLTLDHPPTTKDIQDFAAKNQDLLKNPDKSFGTWHNTANDTHVLDVVSTISDRKKAIALGKKNNQIAIYHLGGEGEIPTGGTGVTPFEPSTGGTPEAPAAPPIPKASESLPLVSTRMPSKTVKGETIEEHTNGALTSDMQAAAAAPGYLKKLADRVADTPGFKDPGGDATTRTNAYIRHVADNVKFVWSKLTPEAIKQDEQWYPVGAHQRGIEVAKQHDVDPHQVYGVTAALSPLTDWDVNTSLAERTTNIWKNQQNTKFTPEMKQAGKDIASIPAMKKFAAKFKKLEGKTLGELTSTRDQALWLRLYDEGHNPREYQTWKPDGTSGGIAKNQDGSPKQVGWSFQNLIEKAIEILKDGSQENISRQLGSMHKIRNFYNNQLAPDDPRFLTIDTHAVNVGQLRPMSGKTPAVKDNFGGISNKPYGLKGTYALHDAGYRLAAKELDIPIPSRLQSPTWVKIREVFPNKFKTLENQQAIDAIWKEHTDGKITIDDARNKIWDYAEGWNSRNAGGVGDTSDQGELFNVGVHGESAQGTAGRGTGSDVAPANQEVAPEEDTSFNFGANIKPAEARSRTSKISATQRAKNDAMVKGLAGLIKSGKK